jgi:miniconductance mechanosensitive channel
MLHADDPGTWLRGVFVDTGLSYSFSSVLSISTLVVIVIFASWLSNVVAKTIILQVVTSIVKKTKSNWDDIFLEQKVFTRLSHFAPAVVLWFMAGWTLRTYPAWMSAFQKMTYIYMVAIGTIVINSFIESWHQIYLTLTISKHRHIKGYVQLLKLVVVLIAILVIISAVFGQRVATLIAGLGAMAAVLILIFKDAILGLVASIQLSANNMVKIGDWITMTSRGVDGQVEDITLTTVKIRALDKTIVTVPAYALVSEVFQNWKGLEDAGVRQIKKSVYIDIRSIRFPDAKLMKKLSRIKIMADIEGRGGIPDAKTQDTETDQNDPSAGIQKFTNLGLFRLYSEEYLGRHPMIDNRQTILVRHLEPSGNGLQLQFLAFCRDRAWVPCEHIQSEILEHFYAIMNEFGLRAFQQPSGNDFLAVSGTI